MSLLNSSWIMLAQAVDGGPAATQGAAATGAQPHTIDDALRLESVWDFLVRGGPTMIAIGLVSLVALTIVFERLLILRRRRVTPPGLIARVNAALEQPDGRGKALAVCEADGSPLANVIAAAVKRIDEPAEVMERHINEAGQRELVRLRHRMRLMSALPQISTMLGLLGTIFGMIKTFQAVAASGESIGKTERLAAGIYEAWTATAAGLFVAIPVMVAYHVIMGRIDVIVAELDRVTLEWVEHHTIGDGARNGRAIKPGTVRNVSRAPDSLGGSTDGAAAAAMERA